MVVEIMDTLKTLNVKVTPLCLGSNTFGWTSEEEVSRTILDTYIAGGGNFIDTADNYSFWAPGNSGGESEKILGRWIQSRSVRDDFILATKCGRHPDFPGLSGANIARAANASLERLQTDYIDVLYAHRDIADVPLEETVEAFEALRNAGKIRAIGISNFSGARIAEWISIADRNGFARPIAVQPHLNLLFRADFDSGVRAVAKEYDLAVVPYFGLASGLLTGKYRTRKDIEASPRVDMLEIYFNDRALNVIDAVVEIAASHETSPATVALAWLRTQPNVVAPLASASRPDQVAGLLASATLELSQDEIEHLSVLSENLPEQS